MKRTPAERQAFTSAAAARMAASPTSAEARLWEVTEMLGFCQQVAIHGHTKNGGCWDYILDLYHPELHLCIEVDGGIHQRKRGHDRRRDTRLAGEGIVTMRVTNNQVLKHRNEVVVAILDKMEELRQ